MSIPLQLDDVEQCVDHILATIGNDIRVGIPLGLGKPPELINALYQRAKANPDIRLLIATALSLEVPDPGKGLQRRFLQPFLERVFGGYPGRRIRPVADAGHLLDRVDGFRFPQGTEIRPWDGSGYGHGQIDRRDPRHHAPVAVLHA